MLKILKCELKRAFSSKLFWVALLIGIAIAAVSAGQNLADYYEGLKMEATRAEYMGDNPYNPMNPMTTVYNYWIGGDYEGPMTPLFYLLMPLLVCLPFSWSYLTDRKSGYINQSMVHIRKKSDYFFAKYIAIFLSGGVVVAVPLILNILTIACFIPAYHPDIFYDMYYSMSFHDMRWLFYTNPVVYEIYIILQAFIFAGLFAVTGYVFSFFIRNRFAVILLPFLCIFGAQYLQDVALYSSLNNLCISPLDFLRAYAPLHVDMMVVALWAAALLVLTLGATWLRGKKADIL